MVEFAGVAVRAVPVEVVPIAEFSDVGSDFEGGPVCGCGFGKEEIEAVIVFVHCNHSRGDGARLREKV